MIGAHLLTTEPVPVRFADCDWFVIYDMRALSKLGQRLAPDDPGLGWLQGVMGKVADKDIDALTSCLWAGMLRENPKLTFAETLSLLDEASLADIVALPGRILDALRQAFGRTEERVQKTGDWDWEVALAVWIKEWGRSEQEFWAASFRTFTSISNGLSRLYRTAQEDEEAEADAQGWTIEELLAMGRRDGRSVAGVLNSFHKR